MSIESSDDFVKKTQNELFKEAVTGKPKPQYILKRPLDIAAADGLLYIIDSVAPHVHVVDLVRRRYFKFGYRFEGKLVNPAGLCVDENGRVYVSDRGRNSIIIYDAFGLYQSEINLQGITTQLSGITTDPKGDFIYALDRGGIDSDFHQIVKLDQQGNVLNRFGKRGSEPGEFNLPMDIAMGTDGLLYVLDTGNFRVQVIDNNGIALHSWGSAGNGFGQFGLPRSISLDGDNNIYISDAQFGNIQIFKADGTLLMHIGRLSQTDKPGNYSLITGISTDKRNNLYILDQYLNKLEIFKKLTDAEQQTLIQTQ